MRKSSLLLATGTDRTGIAARLRSLLAGQAGQDDGDVAATARRLRVDELALRMSLDETSPFPSIDVLAAVVRQYGVDPSYLLTGQYDAATHHRVLEGDYDVAAQTIRELSSSGSAAVAQPNDEPARLHIA